MGKVQLEELERNGFYMSVPKGVSMKPMIFNKQGIVEIRKLEQRARRYDVVLYVRGEQGVLHRVLHVKDDHYVILGDNCWRLEYVPFDDVKGIATRFYRKGKWYDVDNTGYKIYYHIWADFAFIKIPVFYVRDRSKAVLRRIFKRKRKEAAA
ncbi:hypothetical protein SAMN02910456_01730 [Ruminococcaceae bacterium YRB3002]|jgi:hypothetical protein|nr:hypothetical protein SAMN02910456_01730 [Ruminococcaceae bacterium YRB3002]